MSRIFFVHEALNDAPTHLSPCDKSAKCETGKTKKHLRSSRDRVLELYVDPIATCKNRTTELFPNFHESVLKIFHQEDRIQMTR